MKEHILKEDCLNSANKGRLRCDSTIYTWVKMVLRLNSKHTILSLLSFSFTSPKEAKYSASILILLEPLGLKILGLWSKTKLWLRVSILLTKGK